MTENSASSRSNPRGNLGSSTQRKRIASVYDAVAGRIGAAGFLTPAQRDSPAPLPSTPEEVLLRRIGAPDEIPYDYYDADQKLQSFQILPDSDLLKAIHTYASDYFADRMPDNGSVDFRSFDETALLALGILLEEASKETLGVSGDMVLTQPEQSYHRPFESQLARHQIIGRVVPRRLQQKLETMEANEDESEQEESPRKKQK